MILKSQNKSNHNISLRIMIYITIIVWIFLIPLIINNFLDTFVSAVNHYNADSEWDANRLLMSFVFKSQYKLYYPPQEGPVVGMVYGPGMALAYLPATITNSPTLALIFGKLLSLIYFFLPVFLIYINQCWNDSKKIWMCLIVFGLFGFFTLEIPTLSYNAFRIHADTPALGFSALACFFIYYRGNKYKLWPLILSSIFAVLAVWTKQIALPIIVALPLFLYLQEDYKSFKSYLYCLLVSVILISSIFLLLFNTNDLIFNLITIPKNHPWIRHSKIMAFLVGSKDLFQYCFWPGVVALFVSLYQLSMPDINYQIKLWIKKNDWTLFLIISILMIPTSILSRVKIGGNVNGMYTIYFLTIAANLGLLKLMINNNRFYKNISAQIGRFFVIALISFFLLAYLYPPFPKIFRQLSILPHNIHQIVFDYTKNNPDKIYFPWSPLSVMLSTGDVYHFDYGVFDRDLAGYPISKEHFITNIPKNTQFIAIPLWAEKYTNYVESYNSKFFQQYLPEFNKKVELPELPGFIIYTK